MMIRLLNWISNYLAPRRGVLTLIGIVLVGLNFAVQFIPGAAFLAETDLLLHVGVTVGLTGLMLAVTLGG